MTLRPIDLSWTLWDTGCPAFHGARPIPGGTPMNIAGMLRSFSDAVERLDGKAFASLFTEDGVYHDVFYGPFKGRAKIAEMIDDWFYRTASDFRWDMHAPVSDGTTLYARYTFSYRSTLPEAKGA